MTGQLTSVTFECATISDILKKAARVAPNVKANAHADSPGIFIHILEDNSCVVRSTDLEIFLTQWSGYVEKIGPAVNWHIPVSLAQLCSYLPMGSGKMVTFSDELEPTSKLAKSGKVGLSFKCGRTTGEVPLITNFNYPWWDSFDEANSSVVSSLGVALEQVLWACAKPDSGAHPALGGVMLDGEKLMASNRYHAAQVPLAIPSITDPVTVPGGTLAALIKHSGDVRITQTDMGLGISPDEYSQILIRSFAESPLAKVKLPRDFETKAVINSEQMTTVMQRMVTAVKGSDQLINVKMYLANEEILMKMTSPNGTTIKDVVDIPGCAIDTGQMLSFNPEWLLLSMGKVPSHTVEMHYDTSKDTKMVYLRSGNYEAWLAQKLSEGVNDGS